jgi:hypothetical protein
MYAAALAGVGAPPPATTAPGVTAAVEAVPDLALLLSIIPAIQIYSMLRIQARAGCLLACQLMGPDHPV